ncbi:MAG: iron-containing alcohol dehydrogenase [Telmatospirillum sp.]|nr:iron-containing alcohol dehydrogenase [Telmatospirillum sp.]
MQSFEFYNPTRIVFGPGTVPRLDDLVPAEARVLVLLGGSSARKNGTLEEVRTALGAREVVLFEGIEPNPTYETLMRAVTLVRERGIDFLLAVGGGSVIDGTKFVAAAALFDGDPWTILESFGQAVTKALPFGCVLTLPATGSEMNNGAVITRRETVAKLPFLSPHVFPRFSILDPDKTRTLPVRQLVNGVVDAFVHVIEQYLTFPAGAVLQDRFAEGLLQTLIGIGPDMPGDPGDDARGALMWAATLALNGLIGAGAPQDWSTHMIGHELTALRGIDHARTLAAILPANLRVRRDAKRAKLLQYAARVWGITDGPEDRRIDLAIERTRAFFESLGVETRLSSLGVPASDIDVLVGQLEAHGMTALGESHDVTPALSRQILETAF